MENKASDMSLYTLYAIADGIDRIGSYATDISRILYSHDRPGVRPSVSALIHAIFDELREMRDERIPSLKMDLERFAEWEAELDAPPPLTDADCPPASKESFYD